MTKKELLEILETCENDDAHIFINSTEYDENCDVFWGAEYETEIKSAKVECDEVFITVDVKTFNY